MFNDPFGFSREPHHKFRPACLEGGDGFEDVRIFSECEGRHGAIIFLLDLLARSLCHLPIGNCGGENCNVGGKRGLHGLQHLICRLHWHHAHARWNGKRHGSTDQSHLRTQFHRRFGNGIALLAGGMIGNVAHGVNGLARWASGNENVFSGQWLWSGREKDLDGGHNLGRFREAAKTKFTTGHVTGIGTDDVNTVVHQCADVSCGRRMVPHAYVHGRCHKHRFVGREKRCGGEIIGKAGCHLGKKISRGWCHHHKIGGARQLDVAHLGFIGEGEKIGIDLVAGERGHRKRCHEFFCRLRHDGGDADAPAGEQANEFERLVGRNAAADDEENGFAHGRHHNTNFTAITTRAAAPA